MTDRFNFLWFLLIAAVGVLAGRSFWLQGVRGASYLDAAENNHTTERVIQAPRGLINDHNGVQLVENVASSDVIIDPRTLPSKDNESRLLELLPKTLQLPPDEVRGAIDRARKTQREELLLKAISHQMVLDLEEILPELPGGVAVVSSSVRKYLSGDSLAHVLGYSGVVTAEELKANEDLKPTSSIGKTGLEKYYDDLLRGKDGALYQEVNAAGQPLKHLGEQNPEPGADLTLTIDSELQQYIFGLFKERDEAVEDKKTRGVAIALDPRSGAVLALVNYPSFDPNLFSLPILAGQTGKLFSDPSKPLFNRATTGTYPPGSTIKPLLATAALEEGVITATTTVVSTGGISVGPWYFPDWKAGGHGVTNVTKAIAESVNTFFYAVAGGNEEITGLGVDKVTKYLSRFGWGKVTGIDLPQEAAGFLPSADWKEREKGEPWYIGDTYHIGIGQGDVLVTPLQVAQATEAMANGGEVHAPYIVEKHQWPDQDSIIHNSRSQSLLFQKSAIETARQGMREAVLTGSAKQLSALPIELAGKTGTAQTSKEDVTHAWFTSFGPYQAPELVVTVLLEEGGEGDKDAVPMADRIWKWWIDKNEEKSA